VGSSQVAAACRNNVCLCVENGSGKFLLRVLLIVPRGFGVRLLMVLIGCDCGVGYRI
jgi:hypothetical protein